MPDSGDVPLTTTLLGQSKEWPNTVLPQIHEARTWNCSRGWGKKCLSGHHESNGADGCACNKLNDEVLKHPHA
eukprot:3126364-Amphidinium_carterae.1